MEEEGALCIAAHSEIAWKLMSDVEPKWYVVRSQPKRERLAAQTIRNDFGIEVVAPMVRYKKATKRGKVWWSEAMFPGYFFARFDPSEHGRGIQGSRGVLTVVKFGEIFPAVPDDFIEDLVAGLGDGEEVLIDPSVEVGGRYEIGSGSFAGFEGEVAEVLPGGERVRLLIELLGDTRKVEVDFFSILLGKRPDF